MTSQVLTGGFRALTSNSPTQQKVASSAWGRSKRASAMTHKAITLKFVVPTALAVAFAITIDAVIYLVPIDQAEANHSVADSRGIAESPNPDGRLSRVHLLLR
jgi:hypothetical protein